MIENRDKLIEINLKLVAESKDKGVLWENFIDENGNNLDSRKRLAEYLEEVGVIELESSHRQVCFISDLGLNILENGGWFEYLQEFKLVEKEKNRLKEKVEKIEIAKLNNEYKLSKWKVKTYWLVLGLAIFGGIYSLFDFISLISKKTPPAVNTVTQEELKLEISKLRTLILSQRNLDSLRNPKAHLDSLKIN